MSPILDFIEETKTCYLVTYTTSEGEGATPLTIFVDGRWKEGTILSELLHRLMDITRRTDVNIIKSTKVWENGK